MNTESATVNTVVDRQFAETLPLNGRSFRTLKLRGLSVVSAKLTNLLLNSIDVRADLVVALDKSPIVETVQSSRKNGRPKRAARFKGLSASNPLIAVDLEDESSNHLE